MKVSILITTYNLEKYIAYTLDSVLNQKCDFDFEILVGDDGSSDGTLGVIRQYQEKYPDKIKLYKMPREEGVEYDKIKRAAANRINLWSNASGEFISFLDGDDYYTDENRLSKMVAVLDNPKNNDCIMCAHNQKLYYEESGDRSILCRAKKERKIELKDYWPLMFLQSNSLMLRNVYAQTAPSGNALTYFDDNIITFYLFTLGKMYYLPECMSDYRQLADSSWNERDEIKKTLVNIGEIELEKSINPSASAYILARHFKDINFIVNHRNEYDSEILDKVKPFYKEAKRYYYKARIRRIFMKVFNKY